MLKSVELFRRPKTSSWCKACDYEYDKQWRLKNKERFSLLNKRSKMRCKDAIRMRNNEYVRNNPEKVKAWARKWRLNNPSKVAASVRKRQASKLQRTPKWLTPLHYQQIQMFYDSAAALSREFGISMEVDHIIPLRGKLVSGLHVPWNLQVLPETINRRKSNKIV